VTIGRFWCIEDRNKKAKFPAVHPELKGSKNFNTPLTAEHFAWNGSFDAFFLFQLLIAVNSIGDAAPGFQTYKIGIFCRPDAQERKFSCLKNQSMSGFDR
jgi:hypothetical protein